MQFGIGIGIGIGVGHMWPGGYRLGRGCCSGGIREGCCSIRTLNLELSGRFFGFVWSWG